MVCQPRAMIHPFSRVHFGPSPSQKSNPLAYMLCRLAQCEGSVEYFYFAVAAENVPVTLRTT